MEMEVLMREVDGSPPPSGDVARPAPAVVARGAGPFVVGARISLADFLALPSDGVRYDRDEEGRLSLMSPDDFARHRSPIFRLQQRVVRVVPETVQAMVDPAVAFARIYDLSGNLLPESFLGPKAIQPDLACYGQEPAAVEGPSGFTFASPEGLLAVAEVLSPSTYRESLGIGEGDTVNRWRTFLEARVPEYWILNIAVDRPGCPLPPASALFLGYDADRGAFSDLVVEGARPVVEVRGHAAYATGRFRSRILPGFELDLEAFFAACAGRGPTS